MPDTDDGIHYQSDRPGFSTFGETACGRPAVNTAEDMDKVSCSDCKQIVRQMAYSTIVVSRVARVGFFAGLAYLWYLAVLALMDGEIGRAVLLVVLSIPGGFMAHWLVIWVFKIWFLVSAVVLWPLARMVRRG